MTKNEIEMFINVSLTHGLKEHADGELWCATDIPCQSCEFLNECNKMFSISMASFSKENVQKMKLEHPELFI